MSNLIEIELSEKQSEFDRLLKVVENVFFGGAKRWRKEPRPPGDHA